jgi:hypothetical protein
MPPFDSITFGPAAPLLIGDRLPDLGPGRPNVAVKSMLEGLAPAKLFPDGLKQMEMAYACIAGFWLWHDFLDESHAISQEIETPTGAFWHGIMHRREPDYGNAKYWFRRVGPHPVFKSFAAAAAECGLGERLDPFAFVDLCEQHCGTRTATEMKLRQVQRREWQLLFSWCWQQATSFQEA